MLRGELVQEADRLAGDRRPFVVATVVRARRPTSVRPGDAALVTGDGVVHGFVGGVCAETSVRLHALRALETGEPLLLALVPDGPSEGDTTGRSEQDPISTPGAIVERNPCLSGGTLEIFLEPHVPAQRMLVAGESPIAGAVARLAGAAGYHVERGVENAVQGLTAVIVASHGKGEEALLGAALLAGVPYVALVASPKRGGAVRAAIDVPDELRGQLHTPAGLDLGARTPDEIAISILAQMVQRLRADPAPAGTSQVQRAPAPAVVEVAIDPVCGMQVAITEQAPRSERDGETLYFCCDGCRDRYAAAQSARLTEM